MGWLTGIGAGAAAVAAVLSIAYRIRFWRLDELQKLLEILKDAKDAGIDAKDMKALRGRTVSLNRSIEERTGFFSFEGFFAPILLVTFMMAAGGSLGAFLMVITSPPIQRLSLVPILTMVISVLAIWRVIKAAGLRAGCADSADAAANAHGSAA